MLVKEKIIITIILFSSLSIQSFGQELIIYDKDSTTSIKSWILKDSTKKKFSFFQFGGGVINSNIQFQDGVYANQKTQNLIIRKTGNISYSLFGLPLQNSFFIISENGNISHGINRFNFKFDKSQFERNSRELINKVNKNAQDEKQKLYSHINKLKSKRDSLKFAMTLEESDITNILTQNDTLIDCTFIENKAQKLDSLKQRISQKEEEINAFIEKVEQFQQLDSLRQLRNVKPTDFGRYLKLTTIQKLFSSVKTLEIGTFTPNYPKLLVGGLPLKGANIEIQAKNIYLAAARGNFSLSPSFDIQENLENRNENDGTLTLIRAGLGKINSNYIHLSYMTGINNKPFENRFFFNGAELSKNKVFHLSGRYNISKHFYTQGEYAYSISSTNFSQTNSSNEISLVSPFGQNSPNSSYSLKIGSKYPKTKAEVGVRKVGNYYYSLGNPFMRRDVLMINASLSRFIWKKYLQVSSRVSTTTDNLSQTKGYTSATQMALFNIRFMYKKLPQLLLTYSKNKSIGSWEETNTINTSLNTQKSIGIMHSLTIKEVRFSLSANHSNVSILNSFSGNGISNSISVTTVNVHADYNKVSFSNTVLFQKNIGFIARESISQESIISYRLKKLMIGGSIGSGNDNLIGKKFSIGFNLSGSLFTRNRIQLNIKKTYFTSHTVNMMNPLILNLTIAQKF